MAMLLSKKKKKKNGSQTNVMGSYVLAFFLSFFLPAHFFCSRLGLTKSILGCFSDLCLLLLMSTLENEKTVLRTGVGLHNG